MKRFAAIFLCLSVGVAYAQPIDPYAEPPKPEKPKGKGKKKDEKKPPPDSGATLDPYADRGAGVGMTPPPDGDPLLKRRPGGGTAAPTPPPQPPPPDVVDPAQPSGRFDLAAVQGLMAVQNLDGWLIVDHAGQNPVARSLVAVDAAATRRWFYLVPRTGEPTILCHTSSGVCVIVCQAIMPALL